MMVITSQPPRHHTPADAVKGRQNDRNMSNKNKRESIIEACSKQIESIPFITSDGVEFHMADAYICPLCQHVYAIAHEALTLEHVPPESVEGKPILVTCKACNNSQGADS